MKILEKAHNFERLTYIDKNSRKYNVSEVNFIISKILSRIQEKENL